MSIISPMTRKPASIQGVRLFRAFRQGVGLQETTGKNRHLPVVTFYSPPPPSEPASHRRFRRQPRSHSPTHLHTSALPNLSDFLSPHLPQNPNLSTHRFVQTPQLHTPPLVTFHKKPAHPQLCTLCTIVPLQTYSKLLCRKSLTFAPPYDIISTVKHIRKEYSICTRSQPPSPATLSATSKPQPTS